MLLWPSMVESDTLVRKFIPFCEIQRELQNIQDDTICFVKVSTPEKAEKFEEYILVEFNFQLEKIYAISIYDEGIAMLDKHSKIVDIDWIKLNG